MSARVAMIAVALVAVAANGCKDSGLPDRNLPFDEAAHRPPDALVQAVHPDTRARAHASEADRAHAGAGVAMGARPITIGDQTFAPAGQPRSVDAASLAAVGGSGAMSFSAARWDSPPYDALYLAHPGGTYVTYLPVHDDGGDPNARAAAAESGMHRGAAAAH